VSKVIGTGTAPIATAAAAKRAAAPAVVSATTPGGGRQLPTCCVQVGHGVVVMPAAATAPVVVSPIPLCANGDECGKKAHRRCMSCVDEKTGGKVLFCEECFQENHSTAFAKKHKSELLQLHTAGTGVHVHFGSYSELTVLAAY
jgi:hypothetical protein